MIRLDAMRSGTTVRGYDLYRERDLLVTFTLSWARGRGSFQWEGGRYDLYRETPCFGDFVVSQGGRVIARATKNSVFVNAFTVRSEDREFRFRAARPPSGRFVLEEHGWGTGEILPQTWFSPPSQGEFPDGFPIPVCVFLFWLAALIWRRQESFAGNG